MTLKSSEEFAALFEEDITFRGSTGTSQTCWLCVIGNTRVDLSDRQRQDYWSDRDVGLAQAIHTTSQQRLHRRVIRDGYWITVGAYKQTFRHQPASPHTSFFAFFFQRHARLDCLMGLPLKTKKPKLRLRNIQQEQRRRQQQEQRQNPNEALTKESHYRFKQKYNFVLFHLKTNKTTTNKQTTKNRSAKCTKHLYASSRTKQLVSIHVQKI